MKEKTLVLVPSAVECEYLVPDTAQAESDTPFRIWRDGHITWAVGGVGAAAIAVTTASLIASLQPDRIVLAGIAGAYRDSGLTLTEVVQVSQDEFADLGFLEDGFWRSLDDIHLPVLQGQHEDFGCRFQLATLDAETKAVSALTMNRITASTGRAEALWNHFGASLEQMEGAGVALACAVAGIPCFQVRAISNWVGPRDPSTWHIASACEALNVWLGERL